MTPGKKHLHKPPLAPPPIVMVRLLLDKNSNHPPGGHNHGDRRIIMKKMKLILIAALAAQVMQPLAAADDSGYKSTAMKCLGSALTLGALGYGCYKWATQKNVAEHEIVTNDGAASSSSDHGADSLASYHYRVLNQETILETLTDFIDNLKNSTKEEEIILTGGPEISFKAKVSNVNGTRIFELWGNIHNPQMTRDYYLAYPTENNHTPLNLLKKDTILGYVKIFYTSFMHSSTDLQGAIELEQKLNEIKQAHGISGTDSSQSNLPYTVEEPEE